MRKRLKDRVKRIESQLFPEKVNEFQHVQFKGTARIAEEALAKVNNFVLDKKLQDFFKSIFYGIPSDSLREAKHHEIFLKLFIKYIRVLLESVL